jgi:hypothetical protein
MNIDEAKNFVMAIARKNQLGNFPIHQLNLYFQRAQLSVIDELRERYEFTSLISDYLSKLIETKEVFNQQDRFYKPLDYMYWVDFYSFNFTNHSCGNVQKEWTPIELIPQHKLSYRASSTIVKADTEYPVGVNYGAYYIVLPAPQKITLTYVRLPIQPIWGYNVVDDRLVYDPSISQDFELPESVHTDICYKVLSYMGISTRDADLYGATK